MVAWLVSLVPHERACGVADGVCAQYDSICGSACTYYQLNTHSATRKLGHKNLRFVCPAVIDPTQPSRMANGAKAKTRHSSKQLVIVHLGPKIEVTVQPI